MEQNVRGKTIIVTGGAQGIGFSIAKKFLEHGAKLVIILDMDEKGREAANELVKTNGDKRAVFIKCDVTKDLEQVSNEIINTYKTVDILVNNAGWRKEDSIKDTIELNVVALVEWSMKFFDHMRIDNNGNGGTILNVSSIYGFRCEPYSPFYTASKHAVLGFTKSKGHAKTFAKNGVRMIAMCPGFVKTNLVKSEVSAEIDQDVQDYLRTVSWQDSDAVGEAAVEIFKKAESGTAWLIEGGNPIQKLP